MLLCDVCNNVADITTGLQVLTDDICFVLREDTVDLLQDTGLVFVHMKKTMSAIMQRERDIGEIHCADGRTFVAILDQLGCNFDADISLRLQGTSTDMWC